MLKEINNFLIMSLLLVFTLFLQQSIGLIKILSVRPNLVLVTLLFFFFIGGAAKKKFFTVLLLLVLLILVGIFWFPAWSKSLALLGMLILFITAIQSFLGVNPLLDFLFSLVAITFLFYFFQNIDHLETTPWLLILKEVVYSIAIATALWFVIPKAVTPRTKAYG